MTLLTEYRAEAVPIVLGLDLGLSRNTSQHSIRFNIEPYYSTNNSFSLIKTYLFSLISNLRKLDSIEIITPARDSFYLLVINYTKKIFKILMFFSELLHPKFAILLVKINCLKEFKNIFQRLGNESVHPNIIKDKRKILNSLAIAYEVNL